MSKIFTIGHSTHTIEKFLMLLNQHKINVVCDVRSSPYSRINPQYNQEDLKSSLKEKGIKYVFLGKELGARSEDTNCYINGKINYNLLSKTSLFKDGIIRILTGKEKYNIALMCAEKDPLECHRTILVSQYIFANHNIDIQHIWENGGIENHEQATERLISLLNLPKNDMFLTNAEIIEKAFVLQNERIAYDITNKKNYVKNGGAK